MWEVIGYETNVDDKGVITGVTLYLAKDFRPGRGEGKTCRRIWYRANEIAYRPCVGDKIFVDTEVRGKYEFVVDIFQ